jgi:hypothetical protein
MSAYLTSAEYAAWGLTASSATDLLVKQASNIIDKHCHRDGLGVTAYSERISMPEDRNITRLSYGPFVAWDTTTNPANPTGLRGRYGYGRRGGVNSATYEAATLLQLSSAFGGPPAWNNINTSLADLFPGTGELWVPIGIYQAAYSEIEVNYTAGYAVIPDAIKQAVAMIIPALTSAGQSPGARMIKAGDRTITNWSNGVLNDDTTSLLEPYRVRSWR